jgi:hypothetical protein
MNQFYQRLFINTFPPYQTRASTMAIYLLQEAAAFKDGNHGL